MTSTTAGAGSANWPAWAFTAAVVAAAFLWSTSYTATKVALEEIPPLTIGAARFLLAAAALRLIIVMSGTRVTPQRADLGRLALGGLLGITLYFAIENFGVDLATAADAALLVAAYPAITMLLESAVFRTKNSWVRFLGVGIAMIGVYVIVSPNITAGGSARLTGNILLVLSGIVWAFYNFSTRSVGSTYPMLVVIYWQTLAGAIAFVPLALSERAQWQAPSSGTVGLVLYLAAFCSVAAFVLYGHGLRRLRASAAVNLLNLVPVFGLAVALAVLREPVTIVQIVGGLVVIVGVMLAMREQSSAAAANEGPAPRETTEARSPWKTRTPQRPSA